MNEHESEILAFSTPSQPNKTNETHLTNSEMNEFNEFNEFNELGIEGSSKNEKLDLLLSVLTAENPNEPVFIGDLIENGHRKDLNMIEKGRGMMEIFKIHGIDLKPKEIAKIILNIGNKQYNKKAITAFEKQILDIINKIHINSRNIRLFFYRKCLACLRLKVVYFTSCLQPFFL